MIFLSIYFLRNSSFVLHASCVSDDVTLVDLAPPRGETGNWRSFKNKDDDEPLTDPRYRAGVKDQSDGRWIVGELQTFRDLPENELRWNNLARFLYDLINVSTGACFDGPTRRVHLI